jgi:hypothetical protein
LLAALAAPAHSDPVAPQRVAEVPILGHVKKCTSCAKDLPDSALHCVFCGAKQAQATVPGTAAQQARTVLGYQAGDVVKELERQGVTIPRSGSQPPPMQPPQQLPQVHAPSQAPTLFIPGGAGPGPMPMQSAPMPLPGPMGGSAPVQMPMHHQPGPPMPIPMHHQPGPPMPIPMAGGATAPAAIPPYLASQTAARAARPIEPFADGLKLVLLSFGIILLGAFATPLSTDPMLFHWNAIVDAPGVAKLFGLMLVATGALAIAIALMPLGAVSRGAITAGIGLFIIATPIIQAGGIDPWQLLLRAIGSIVLVAGLLIRHEYREARLGRVLATVGAACVLSMYLIPEGGGDIPLVQAFTTIIDAPLAEQKIAIIVQLVPVVLAIVSLLVWLPAPASAGSKALAWMWIVFPALELISVVVVSSGGDLGAVIQQSPFGALMAWVPATAAAAYVGYGVASVLGKQLE